jgi:hypothetical protein
MESGGFTGGWMDGTGFTIRSADGNYSMTPGVHFQFRTTTVYNDQVRSNGDANIDNGFEIHNLRFSLEGTAITKRLHYYFVWNSADGGTLTNEEAYVQYDFADNFAVKLGQYREMIYHEQAVHDKRQMAADRSLLNEVLNGGQSFVQGVDLIWDPRSGFRGDIAFTDGYNSRNTNFQDPPSNAFDFGVHARVEWAVMGDFRRYNQFTSLGYKGGDDLLVIGAGGDWSQSGDFNVYHHNIDAQWNSGPLGIYVAYVGLYTDPGNAGGSSSWDCGALVQASYLLNAQWELFGRYDYLHVSADSPIVHGTENTFHEIAVGLNYYLHGQNAKFTFDFGWLPNGAPNNQSQIGVLANDGQNEYYVRGQFQLVL